LRREYDKTFLRGLHYDLERLKVDEDWLKLQNITIKMIVGQCLVCIPAKQRNASYPTSMLKELMSTVCDVPENAYLGTLPRFKIGLALTLSLTLHINDVA